MTRREETLNDRAERETTGRGHWSQARLFSQLQKLGLIDEHGVNAKPKLRHCAGCGLLVWAAWRDGCMPTVLVDDIALTPRGEYETWMAGRRTFTHWLDGLDTRTADSIRRWPASEDPFSRIRPEHRCNDPNPDHYPNVYTRPDFDAPPPF